MFRQLDDDEIVFLQKLWAQARLPELPLEQARVEFRREGKPAQHGREQLPPAFTICTISYHTQPFGEEGAPMVQTQIGVAHRGFKDRENPIVGERIALVRAIRSEPIGLNP